MCYYGIYGNMDGMDERHQREWYHKGVMIPPIGKQTDGIWHDNSMSLSCFSLWLMVDLIPHLDLSINSLRPIGANMRQ